MPLQCLEATTNRIEIIARLGNLKDYWLNLRHPHTEQSNDDSPQVFEVFKKTSLILHAGDLTKLSVVEELERLAPVRAICGNMDDEQAKTKLPKMDFVNVYNWKIGVIHNVGVWPKKREMRKLVEQNSLDILIFGHTHRLMLKQEAKTLFINPGSPTNPIPPFLIKPSVALLKISKQKVKPRIVYI